MHRQHEWSAWRLREVEVADQVSDRQWRDVAGILRIHGDVMDVEYLRETARELDLIASLDDAANAANLD